MSSVSTMEAAKDGVTLLALEIRSVRLGSLKIKPCSPVMLSPDGIDISWEEPKKKKQMDISINSEDIVAVHVHNGTRLPVFFVECTVECGERVRNILKMKCGKDPVFDPGDSEKSRQGITCLGEPKTSSTNFILHEIFMNVGEKSGRQVKITDLDYTTANSRLVSSAPYISKSNKAAQISAKISKTRAQTKETLIKKTVSSSPKAPEATSNPKPAEVAIQKPSEVAIQKPSETKVTSEPDVEKEKTPSRTKVVTIPPPDNPTLDMDVEEVPDTPTTSAASDVNTNDSSTTTTAPSNEAARTLPTSHVVVPGTGQPKKRIFSKPKPVSLVQNTCNPPLPVDEEVSNTPSPVAEAEHTPIPGPADPVSVSPPPPQQYPASVQVSTNLGPVLPQQYPPSAQVSTNIGPVLAQQIPIAVQAPTQVAPLQPYTTLVQALSNAAPMLAQYPPTMVQAPTGNSSMMPQSYQTSVQGGGVAPQPPPMLSQQFRPPVQRLGDVHLPGTSLLRQQYPPSHPAYQNNFFQGMNSAVHRGPAIMTSSYPQLLQEHVARLAQVGQNFATISSQSQLQPPAMFRPAAPPRPQPPVVSSVSGVATQLAPPIVARAPGNVTSGSQEPPRKVMRLVGPESNVPQPQTPAMIDATIMVFGSYRGVRIHSVMFYSNAVRVLVPVNDSQCNIINIPARDIIKCVGFFDDCRTSAVFIYTTPMCTEKLKNYVQALPIFATYLDSNVKNTSSFNPIVLVLSTANGMQLPFVRSAFKEMSKHSHFGDDLLKEIPYEIASDFLDTLLNKDNVKQPASNAPVAPNATANMTTSTGAVASNGAVITENGASNGIVAIPPLAKNAEDDEFDDLIMVAETLTTKCPYTQQIMTDPVQNKHCNHNYERKAVAQIIKNTQKNARCPVLGCSNAIPLDMKDMNTNESLRKKIEAVGW